MITPAKKYISGFFSAAYDVDWKENVSIEETRTAYFGERPLIIDRNNPLLFVSQDFEWGFRSKGTKQLAISILLELEVPSSEVLTYAEMLVEDCLSIIPSKRNFSIQIYALEQWLKHKKGITDIPKDLIFYTNIEEPERPKPPEKKPQIVPPPPIASIVSFPIKEQIKRGKRGYTYPFADLEVGEYYYCLNISAGEKNKISSALTHLRKIYKKVFVARTVNATWAREHGISVAQDNAEVFIVFRTA